MQVIYEANHVQILVHKLPDRLPPRVAMISGLDRTYGFRRTFAASKRVTRNFTGTFGQSSAYQLMVIPRNEGLIIEVCGDVNDDNFDKKPNAYYQIRDRELRMISKSEATRLARDNDARWAAKGAACGQSNTA